MRPCHHKQGNKGEKKMRGNRRKEKREDESRKVRSRGRKERRREKRAQEDGKNKGERYRSGEQEEQADDHVTKGEARIQ